MAKPIKQDLYCYRGQTYSQNFYFSKDGYPLSLSGLTAKSQIRPTENSNTLIAEFTCSITEEEGKLNLSLPSDVTAGIRTGNYVWDLKITDDENLVNYWMAGKFIVSGRVTE